MFRWFAWVSLVGCLAISVYNRRRARREGETIPRRREGARLMAGRGLVALPLFAAILAYLVNPRWMAWASYAGPTWSRWAGVILGIVTVPAAYWVFRSLGRHVSETVLTKEHHELVTHGPYRWIRHPLYANGIALLLAIGLMAANWLILALTLIALVAIGLVVVPAEESALLAKFGAEYRAYMGRTGGLWPRAWTPS